MIVMEMKLFLKLCLFGIIMSVNFPCSKVLWNIIEMLLKKIRMLNSISLCTTDQSGEDSQNIK